MLPRTIQRTTSLIHNGKINAVIIYPQDNPAYRQLAQNVGNELNHLATNQVSLFADRELMPDPGSPLTEQYRSQPLILLGNLNNNRALLPLYASYYCFTDALYPGGEGYDLRTLVNPYGKGPNVILAGGSSFTGTQRAVERLIDHIRKSGNIGDLELPFLLEVEIEPELKRMIYDWPEVPLNVPPPGTTTELLKRAGSFGIMYALTGDRIYGEVGANYIKIVNAQMGDSYGDRHYTMERVMRALPWLEAGGFLSDGEILRTDNLLRGMALASQNAWWRMKSAKPPLGHRHHGKGTHEFYLVARYLREQAAPEPELATLCDRWIAECQSFLDGLGQAGLDDQDDETTMNNMTTLFWYSLSAEHFDFFESGAARSWAQRAIALHDNMGSAAGPGGYGEAQLGITFVQHEATTAIASCAFYYQDGRFKWILEHLPRLKLPLRGGWAFCPIYLHKFDTGPELAPQEPEGLTGLQVLPATRYQVELNNQFPIHLEYAGHTVNAPENWLNPEGIAPNHLPQERGFDKIVLRSGYHWEDPYLIIQGYQGGFRWQGHMKAANCILRFSQAGHIFLMQNTRQHSQYFKNGVLVSDGFNNTAIPPIAEWLAVDDFSKTGVSITRLNDYHHTSWTRHLFWSKQSLQFFVVVDYVIPEVEGDYSAVCTWRSLLYASLEGRTWHGVQGEHRFTLRSSENLVASCEEERDLGAANPFVLHQFKGGHYQKGEPIVFQNVFYVRPIDQPEDIDIRQISHEMAFVLYERRPFALVVTSTGRMKLPIPEMEMEACSGWITSEEVVLSGATRLDAGASGLQITVDVPSGIEIDLVNGKLTARLDSPASQRANLTIQLEGKAQTYSISDKRQVQIDLPDNLCTQLSKEISAQFMGYQLPKLVSIPPVREFGDLWFKIWRYENQNLILERIREMTVQASPPPLDGIADQLIDTVTLESRELWQLWPKAPEYTITLTFPAGRSVDHLDLIGDSKVEPIFKVFSPLPAHIKTELSQNGIKFEDHSDRVNPIPGEINFSRYRAQWDRLESRQIDIKQVTQKVRITLDAPAGDRPLVLQEIAAYGSNRVAAEIKYLLSADLQGKGLLQILVVDTANRLVVLSQDGTDLWQHQFPIQVSHITCHDLDNDGRKYICVGLLGGDLVILSPEGEVHQQIRLAEEFSALKDVFEGQYNTPFTTNIWQRDRSGRGALVVGAYSMLIFLDPDGKILGHSWFDGPWVLNILTAAQDEAGSGDLWVRCGWNHGIACYQGFPGFEPSGEGQTFGGVFQPMFRPLRRLIPFVNGRTVTFEWSTIHDGPDRMIVAAAEDGVGVLSTSRQDFLWKVEGGTSLTSCITLDRDGQHEILAGGVDGFIASFDFMKGSPIRRLWTGSPVVGLVSLDEGHILAVVTTQGLWALDKDWQMKAFYPLEAIRVCPLGQRGLVVACKGGSLVGLELSK